jgi:hypothetical protein
MNFAEPENPHQPVTIDPVRGMVPKQYRAGPSRHWIKVKNPASPAVNRAKDAFG